MEKKKPKIDRMTGLSGKAVHAPAAVKAPSLCAREHPEYHPLSALLTVFRGYDARSGSSSARYMVVNYRGKENRKRPTPPIVGDMTTKNCVHSSEHLYILKSGSFTH